jgi:hypothetical protein
MFTRARNKLEIPWYPQRTETYDPDKNPYDIPKIPGEIRLVSCDVAQRAGKQNDLSITSCIRLTETSKGYLRTLVYMESFSGVDSISQCLRIKQLFYDFGADVLVLDVAAGGGGLTMYDQLGTIAVDEERGIEYPAMTIINDSTIKQEQYEELLARTRTQGAIPCIYPISATGQLNSIIAVEMRDKLQKRLFEFLCDETRGEDALMKSPYSSEFLDQEDNNARPWFLTPYFQTSLLVNESINLSMTYVGGNIKLSEPSGSRKDRYTSVSYGNYYASLLDRELLKAGDAEDQSEEFMKLMQWV